MQYDTAFSLKYCEQKVPKWMCTITPNISVTYSFKFVPSGICFAMLPMQKRALNSFDPVAGQLQHLSVMTCYAC